MGESSGWVMESIKYVDLSIAKCEPRNSSRLKGKKAVVNVKNKDKKCFLYSVFPQNKNTDRVGKLKKESIELLIALMDIDRLEKENSEYIINVYECEENESNIFTRRIRKRRYVEAINTLMLENVGRETIMYV